MHPAACDASLHLSAIPLTSLAFSTSDPEVPVACGAFKVPSRAAHGACTGWAVALRDSREGDSAADAVSSMSWQHGGACGGEQSCMRVGGLVSKRIISSRRDVPTLPPAAHAVNTCSQGRSLAWLVQLLVNVNPDSKNAYL